MLAQAVSGGGGQPICVVREKAGNLRATEKSDHHANISMAGISYLLDLPVYRLGEDKHAIEIDRIVEHAFDTVGYPQGRNEADETALAKLRSQFEQCIRSKDGGWRYNEIIGYRNDPGWRGAQGCLHSEER